MMKKQPLVLEVLIPCKGTKEENRDYVQALLREVRSYEFELSDYEIQAVRLGGAASSLGPELLQELLFKVCQILPVAENAEISLSVQPGEDPALLLAGDPSSCPNRLELVACSMSRAELAAIGCSYDEQDIRRSFQLFQNSRFNNLSLLLNFGIPGQSLESWQYTLSLCADLAPAQFSILPFAQTDAENVPDVEACCAMFSFAIEFLQSRGYVYHGSGLFALPAYENCFELQKHHGCDILALGVGAMSKLDGYYTRNTDNCQLYIEGAGAFEKITAQVIEVYPSDEIREYITGRLGLVQGLRFADYRRHFHTPLPVEIMSFLFTMERSSWMKKIDGGFVLTPVGEVRTKFGHIEALGF